MADGEADGCTLASYVSEGLSVNNIVTCIK